MGNTFDVFSFQAEDGIRDGRVTGVQTCALPISANGTSPISEAASALPTSAAAVAVATPCAKNTRATGNAVTYISADTGTRATTVSRVPSDRSLTRACRSRRAAERDSRGI